MVVRHEQKGRRIPIEDCACLGVPSRLGKTHTDVSMHNSAFVARLAVGGVEWGKTLRVKVRLFPCCELVGSVITV